MVEDRDDGWEEAGFEVWFVEYYEEAWRPAHDSEFWADQERLLLEVWKQGRRALMADLALVGEEAS